MEDLRLLRPGWMLRPPPRTMSLAWTRKWFARLAGVPNAQILQMARLATSGQPTLGDLPAARPKKKPTRNVLSESEGEGVLDELDEPIEQMLEGQLHDPMTQAVAKLTQIASYLAQSKQKPRTLNDVLDGAGGLGSNESLGSSMSRKNAAALRLLRPR